MSGILGAVSLSGEALPDPAQFEAALAQMRRRGPDLAATWGEPRIRLGHGRVTILDPSDAGRQPMTSGDGRYVIVFDGEIYNHRELRAQLPTRTWRSHSDTEALVDAWSHWGVACLDRLDGIFALAVWDRQARSLTLARDRLGMKPLHYAWDRGRLLFASRPAALLRLLGHRTTDFEPDALRAYLELGYVPTPLSIHRALRKLPPAHYLAVDPAGPRPVRYWDFRHIEPAVDWLHRNEEDLADELDAHLERAVSARLCSDVPLGAFLSGGVDSATVVATMRRQSSAPPLTFTVGFGEPACDESAAAAQVARAVGGVEHVTETLRMSDMLDLLPSCVEAFGEPFADVSAIPTMAVARLARRRVTVALTGDGGDELFGGHPCYRWVERIARLHGQGRVPRGLRHAMGRALSVAPAHRAKLLAGALRFDDLVPLFQYLRSFSKDYPPVLDAGLLASTTPAVERFEQFAADFPLGLRGADVGMRLDLGFTLVDDYLQKVDLATVACSLEARCPLIDHHLVEWAMRLPTEFKLRNGQSKYLLRKVLKRHLPAALVDRPKLRLGVPMGAWLRGPLRTWACDLIHDHALMSRVPLDARRVAALFEQHVSGRRDAHPLLWAVLMLLSFVAREIENGPRPLIVPGDAA